MEKLQYERPVMRAQVFRANASVAACNRMPVFEGVDNFFKAVCGSLNLFFSTDRIAQVNPNTHQQQYYFVEDTVRDTSDAVYFLEWSADHNTYYVYEDSDKSGTGWNTWLTKAEDTDAGQGTLQVNTGLSDSPYACINIWGEKWFSDKYVGGIDGDLILGEEQKVSYVASY